jgi:hypothetical protein
MKPRAPRINEVLGAPIDPAVVVDDDVAADDDGEAAGWPTPPSSGVPSEVMVGVSLLYYHYRLVNRSPRPFITHSATGWY